MKKSLSIFVLAVILGLSVSPCGAMTKGEVDIAWKNMIGRLAAKQDGSEKAKAIRAELDVTAKTGALYPLWNAMLASEGNERLINAWSILKNCVPDGDLTRWAEVNYFDVPSITPKMFMIVDALYVAMIELVKIDGGEWLAADLIKDFSTHPYNSYDFINVCPASVAEAISVIVEKTDMSRNWLPRAVIGSLPIARSVDGAVSYSSALGADMVFLDGAGAPTSGYGFYAWDRKKGHIYEVIDSNSINWRS